MRFSDLNWFDIEDYLAQDDRLILILGATEQHSYLSLLTDVNIPLALADAASQQTNVLIAPPLNFGVSPYFLAYPGTISLRTTTLLAVVEEQSPRSDYRPAGTDEKTIKAVALATEGVQKALDGQPPKKVIIVPGRLINIVA